jgi:hypothetical protein
MQPLPATCLRTLKLYFKNEKKNLEEGVGDDFILKKRKNAWNVIRVYCQSKLSFGFKHFRRRVSKQQKIFLKNVTFLLTHNSIEVRAHFFSNFIPS